MKSLLSCAVVAILILSSCGNDDQITVPPSPKELIVGNWQSTVKTEETSINGLIALKQDTVETGINLNFTSSFWVYTDFKGVTDTSRYNVDEAKNVFLIKNALAFDTLVIKSIDEASLVLTLESEEGQVNGSTFKTETNVSFSKQ